MFRFKPRNWTIPFTSPNYKARVTITIFSANKTTGPDYSDYILMKTPSFTPRIAGRERDFFEKWVIPPLTFSTLIFYKKLEYPLSLKSFLEVSYFW